MSRTTLIRLNIENFKGLKFFEFSPDGEDTEILGENERGKTTVADAYSWLLAGKDTTERKEFDIRPLDRNNRKLKGLIVSVTGQIDCDGVNHILRKEHHENISKGKLKGYETKCWIDEVKFKVSDYQEWVSENVAPLDVLRLITNLHYFCEDKDNGGIHWSERYKTLFGIAGEIGEPEGFEEMIADRGSRKLTDYIKLLSDRKTGFEKEQGQTGTRIDEKQRGLVEYVEEVDVESLNKKRTEIKAEIKSIDDLRKKVAGKEKERQQKIDALNELKAKRVQREAELASDTSGTQGLLDEKRQLELEVHKTEEAKVLIDGELYITEIGLTNSKNELASMNATLSNIRKEQDSAEKEPTENTCYACGQELPPDKLKENEADRKAKVDEVKELGDELMRKVKDRKHLFTKLESNIKKLRKQKNDAEDNLKQVKESADKRIAEINEAVENRATPSPEQDEQWKKICEDIEKAEKAIGKSVSEQLSAIDKKRSEKSDELANLDKVLAHADEMKKAKARIEELKADQKRLAQQIADVDKRLHEIKLYKLAQSKLLNEAVNDKFEVAEFKMYKEHLNGEVEPCCEVMHRGVPYAELSKGRKIRMGLDVVKTLSEFYGISVPLFIDNAESITIPYKTFAQKILLITKDSYTEKVITLEGVKEIFHDYSKLTVQQVSKKKEKAVA